jgi:hypothetical protein
MYHINPLTNFPIELLQEFNSLYTHTKNSSYEKWSRNHNAIQLDVSLYRGLFQKYEIRPKDVYLFKLIPGIVTPHIDRGRRTALQIPMHFLQNSFTSYTVSPNNINLLSEDIKATHRPAKENENIVSINQSDKMFFLYNKDYCDHFVNTGDPYLMDVSIPHGGINTITTDVLFWSLGFYQDYDTVLNYYKDWI